MDKKDIPVISIDTGVPVPEPRSNYPLAQLEVGESFLIPLSKRPNISSSIARAKDKYPERKFATRKEGDKEFTDSFNVNKVIRSIAFDDELVILLDDIHEQLADMATMIEREGKDAYGR